MSVIAGTVVLSPSKFYGGLTTHDLDVIDNRWNPGQSIIGPSPAAAMTRIMPSTGRVIEGYAAKKFSDDYYYRVHVTPLYFNLGTLSSLVQKQFFVWNAWLDRSASLDNINVTNSSGITLTGQMAPYEIKPNMVLTYYVNIGMGGPPAIKSDLLFDFSNVPDPFPLVIVGLRALLFGTVPEVPVVERWDWLTDVITATDGTEQRISVRGNVPRTELKIKTIFDTSSLIRGFYSDLVSSYGRLWVPEYQYATTITAQSLIGTFQLYFDNTRTDIRDGEYVIIKNGTVTMIVEIGVINASGATVTAPLSATVPVGYLIMPGSAALIEDQSSLDRYHVNEVAEVSLNCRMMRSRTELVRQGSSVTLPTFLTYPVLDKMPLADDMPKDTVSTGQVTIDNSTGIIDVISRWDYSRVGGLRSFKVNRILVPAEMDFWKTFFAYARGAARKFFMPTYRTDLILSVAPASAASAISVMGTDYVRKVWPILTHRYLELETASGILRVSVTDATESSGNSLLSISPSLPAGAGYTSISRISYLLPMRLGSDSVEWKHFGLESILSFSTKTAE